MTRQRRRGMDRMQSTTASYTSSSLLPFSPSFLNATAHSLPGSLLIRTTSVSNRTSQCRSNSRVNASRYRSSSAPPRRREEARACGCGRGGGGCVRAGERERRRRRRTREEVSRNQQNFRVRQIACWASDHTESETFDGNRTVKKGEMD
jgi:hypothetical protein